MDVNVLPSINKGSFLSFPFPSATQCANTMIQIEFMHLLIYSLVFKRLSLFSRSSLNLTLSQKNYFKSRLNDI